MRLPNCCRRICTSTMCAMLGVSLPVFTHAQAPKHYEATIESLDQHPLPQWFDDAKLGIFIHWGLYSVPGWAPLEKVDFTKPDFLKFNAGERRETEPRPLRIL